MTLLQLILRTWRYFFASNITTAAGVSIATAVICGAIIIGDSLSQSLLNIVDYRLGQISHSLTAGDRIFSRSLADNISNNHFIKASPILKTEAIITNQNKNISLNKINVWGVDTCFNSIIAVNDNFLKLDKNEAIISHNLATQLKLDTGDIFLMKAKLIGAIPYNTPFVAEDNQTVSRRFTVKAIADEKNGGHFNLQISQTAPFNIFVSINQLNSLMQLDDKANMIVISANKDNDNEYLKKICRKALQIEDINLALNEWDNSVKISSERVFIEDYISNSISNKFPDARYSLTYFVNSINLGDKSCPYSFVAATSEADIKPNQIIINEWLANDLNAKIGDSLTIIYYEVGPLRNLIEKNTELKVVAIKPMINAKRDSVLMPFLPGLSDAGNCRDWETGIPINLDLIRKKDEDYWDTYKGTPKAYISLHFGQQLWQNRFGNISSVIIPSHKYGKQEVRDLISQSIDPFKIDFQINNVREQGVKAAKSGVDFTELFAGLGMFIIIAGLLLTVLLLNLSLKKRESQIKLFTNIGFSVKLIKKIFLVELIAITLIGGILGIFISMAYSKLILFALNDIWYDIVRTSVLSINYSLSSLSIGFLASIILSFIVIYWGINKRIKNHSIKAGFKSELKTVGRKKGVVLLSSVLFLSGLIILLFLLITKDFTALMLWFIAGVLFFISFVFISRAFFYSVNKKPNEEINLVKLSFRNLKRNPARSLTIVILLMLGTFIIIITASNRQTNSTELSAKNSGSGGFLFFAETTVPVLRNLNAADTKLEYSLPEQIDFVQFLSAYDDDASCLNLNRVANPRIIAIDPSILHKRFSFATNLGNEHEAWEILNKDFGDIIPAIADQTVIQWGLGKNIGDTLYYTDSQGKEIKLLLAGGLNNSVFQGNVIISEKNFNLHFPARGGTNVFLINADYNNIEETKEKLEFIFRDYGWEMKLTSDKLSEFNTVQNTYLAIFFLMGAFGMLIGTIGLAVVLAKSLIERKSEIAVLKALGFSNKLIIHTIFYEYFSLFILGIILGTLSAFVATWPVFVGNNLNSDLFHVFAVLLVLSLNGLFWILTISYITVKKIKPNDVIKE